MSNDGSTFPDLSIVNFIEEIWGIKEGAIKPYLYDENSETWVRSPLHPYKPRGASVFGTGVVTVSSTLSQALSDIDISEVYLRASLSNTGIIYIGDSMDVDSVNGYPLQAGEKIDLNIDNLNKIYVKSSVDNDKLNYLYIV